MPFLALSEITIACTDVDRSTAFYVDCFDWEALREGDDVVVGAPGCHDGRLRLTPAGDGAVHALEAQPWDLGARMISIYTRDVVQSRRLVERNGGHVGPTISYEPFEGRAYAEYMGRGPDGVMLIFPQPDRYMPSPALENDATRLHGEVHNICITVEDLPRADAFFTRAGGLNRVFGGVIDGQELRDMMQMPDGSTCEMMLLSGKDERPARVELLTFEGVEVRDVGDAKVGVVSTSYTVAGAGAGADAVAAALVAAGGRAVADRVVVGPGGLPVELLATKGEVPRP